MKARPGKRRGEPAVRPPVRARFPRPSLPILLLLLAVFVVKAAVLAQLNAHPLLQPTGELDPAYYVDLARQVAAGHDVPVGQAFFVSPLYVYFLALVFALAGGSLVAAKVVQIALGTAAVWLIWRTAHDWFGERAAWLSAALAASSGVFTFYEVTFLQAALDPFLTALDLFVVSRAWRRGTARSLFAAGLALGLHALNRPNVLPYAALLLALVPAPSLGATATNVRRIVRERMTRTFALRVAAYACGLVVAVGPIAIRNYNASGEMVLISSHGGLNFYIGNNATADGTYSRVAGVTPSIAGQARDADRVADSALGRRLGPSEVSDYFYARAWQWIRSNRAAAGALFVRKLFYVFNATFLTLNYSFPYYSHDASSMLRLLIVGPWLLIPLGLVGLVLPKHDAAGGRLAYFTWAGFVPVYAVSVAIFFVSSRYRMPLLVPLAVGAGAAFDAAFRLADARRFRQLGMAATAAAALALVANWNLGIDNGIASERTKLLVHLVETGDDDGVRAMLPRAEAGHPHVAMLLYMVGRAYLNRGDAARALPLLERAVALEPKPAEVRLALGQALCRTGRPVEALPHLQAAVDAKYRTDVALPELVRALSDAGRREDALRVLQVARASDQVDARSDAALGTLSLQMREPQLAEPLLRRAVERAPDDGRARESFGLALAMLGRHVEAADALEAACRLDAGNAEARLNLAVVYANMGRLDDARRLAQEALRLQPDYPQARQLLAALNSPSR